MIVVSDTSPLNYLILIDAIDVLPKLFNQIHIPTAVVKELLHPKTPDVVSKWIQRPPSWFRISTPKNIFPPAAVLDPSEAAAISLAKELGAEAVLIDERKGRLFASKNGLVSFGTLTILELASEIKLIDLRNSLHALQRTSFYLTDALINDILKRSSEK